jgi:hypothetical protein
LGHDPEIVIGSGMVDETMIDGRTLKDPRSIIDHRHIDHAGLSISS